MSVPLNRLSTTIVAVAVIAAALGLRRRLLSGLDRPALDRRDAGEGSRSAVRRRQPSGRTARVAARGRRARPSRASVGGHGPEALAITGERGAPRPIGRSSPIECQSAVVRTIAVAIFRPSRYATTFQRPARQNIE
jgi:hypothetical protein